jgi:MFS family permease
VLFNNFRSISPLKPVIAVGFLFAVSSLLFGTWVATIPAIKDKFGFTDGTLGLILLLSPLGAITGVFISTKVFSRIRVGAWMLSGYMVQCVIMIMQVNSINAFMLGACLYSFGLISFLNGVSTNATISVMEKKYDRLLMSTCHALYSLGGAVSAGLAAGMLALKIPGGWQIIIVVACICPVLFFSRHLLLDNRDIIHSGGGLQLPSLSVLGISFICMTVFMAEGCVADWSGIYFKEVLHAPAAFTSMGYGVFAVAMTIGRLNGDHIVSQIGNKKAVIGGCLLACIGFILVLVTPLVLIAVIGYIVIGSGCSCIVPVLFRASANIPGVSRVEGFAMVTTGGLIGFLAGPSVIGFISEKSGLSAGLSLLIVMTLLAATVAWRNQFLTGRKISDRDEVFDEQLY